MAAMRTYRRQDRSEAPRRVLASISHSKNDGIKPTAEALDEIERTRPSAGNADNSRLSHELEQLGTIQIENRDTGHGYRFSVVALEYNHPLVQKVNE
jgi:hypothetical protein